MARLKIRVQLYCGEEIAMGPGKAALLEAIRDSGSISGAARQLGMSYRRAWLLVDAMNRCFADRLVETHPGGGRQAGASLSATGTAVLADYRALLAAIDAAAQGEASARIVALLRDEPLQPA